MAKIVFQTSAWGHQEGAHYIEFEINGVALQILVTDDIVNVNSPAPFGDKETRACNSVYVLPRGSQFKTVHEYHVWRDKQLRIHWRTT